MPFKAGVLYFLIVFGNGFVLGTMRVLWLVPRFGARIAELMEMPVMLAVSYGAASWITRRFLVSRAASSRLAMCGFALLLLVLLEFTLVPWLRGMSLSDYFANLDPVSGLAYYAALGFFAIAPYLISKGPP